MKTMRSASMATILFLCLIGCIAATAATVQAATPKQIYRKAGPGVVFIFASQGSNKGSGGTGSIISRDGLVITNAHLFTQKDSSQLLTNISVFLKPDRVTGDHKADLSRGYRGKLLAYDLALDLALVKITGLDQPLTTIDFADSETAEIGDEVFAIGHPEQGGLWSLTTGVISAHWRNYGGVPGKHLFQTDASINRGNSGGPLLDQQGTMIGINSMIARKAADGLTITDVNFSIRSKVALDWLDKNGYHFTAVQPMREPAPAAPKTAESPPEETPAEEDAIAAAPSETEKIEKPAAEEPALESPDTEPPAVEEKASPPAVTETPAAPASPATDEEEAPAASPEPDATKDKDKLLAQNPPKGGKILTEKKPYRMDDLLEGMQEMEDLMDEMKDMMKDFKERSKL